MSSRAGLTPSRGLSLSALSATEARSTPGPSGIFGGVTMNLAPVLSAGAGSRASSSSSKGGAGIIRLNAASSSTGACGGSTPSSSDSTGVNGSGETGSLTLTRTGPVREPFRPVAGGAGPSTRCPKRSSEVARRSSSGFRGGPGASFGLPLPLLISRPGIAPDSIGRPHL